MARRLPAETVMTVTWIAERLSRGSRKDANLVLWLAAGSRRVGNTQN